MNKAIVRYRRRVIRSMHCPRDTRKKLLRKLDALLTSFQEDEPDADAAQFEQAFGSPSEMANSLCEGISEEVRLRWKYRHRMLIAACALFSIGVIVILSYMSAMRFAEVPIYVVKETYISDSVS